MHWNWNLFDICYQSSVCLNLNWRTVDASYWTYLGSMGQQWLWMNESSYLKRLWRLDLYISLTINVVELLEDLQTVGCGVIHTNRCNWVCFFGVWDWVGSFVDQFLFYNFLEWFDCISTGFTCINLYKSRFTRATKNLLIALVCDGRHRTLIKSLPKKGISNDCNESENENLSTKTRLISNSFYKPVIF